jgi:uncharacterized protein YkwD
MSAPPAVPALATAAAALAACAAPPAQQVPLGPDGRPLPVVYRISPSDAPRVQLRMRDALSALRNARGLSAVELNAQLTSAAATQSRSMSQQGRPWNFGPDGSSPIERVAQTGYTGRFLGEVIAETYESELETLAGWMETRETRAVLLDPAVREIGFAWYQEPSGKLWWTLTMGTPLAPPSG